MPRAFLRRDLSENWEIHHCTMVDTCSGTSSGANALHTEEHEKHLGIVFQWLRDHHFFLSKSKVDLYSKRLECLSHIIDDWGIHADADKMQCIREWMRPRSFNNVQHFLGLVQYLAHYMPDISAYTTPTIGLCKKQPSIWMDALVRKVSWEHQNTSMQGSNIQAYWLW